MSQPKLFTREQTLPGIRHYSVIRKVVMAISGITLVAFLYGHWNGNRVLLDGEIAFNAYLLWLEDHVLLHYGIWIIVVIALIAHLAVGPSHWWHNRRARPVAYRKKHHQSTTWAACSMMISGTILLLFLVLHIAQVRGWLEFETGGVYRNLQAGFTHWEVVSVYLLGQLALAFHLYHGLWSLFQTLGMNHRLINHWRRPIAAVIGIGIALLNCTLILLNLTSVQHLLGITT